MNYENYVLSNFKAISTNESLARMIVSSFVSSTDIGLNDLLDIKTAVSEAVTNAIIHGYDEKNGEVSMLCALNDGILHIEITDYGKGISNIEKARTPLFTSKPELERSGMGFTVMEMLMDSLEVISEEGKGTKIILTKKISSNDED